jgi:hypothetical protein
LTRPKSRWTRPVALAAAAFGALTILSGSLVLFGPESARQAAGNAGAEIHLAGHQRTDRAVSGRAFSAAMTLPMSRMLAAPVSATAASTAAATSSPIHLARQEFLDHPDLVQFALGQFQPAALFIGLGRFLTLLDHLGQDRGQIGLAQPVLIAAIGARGDLAVLDRGR